MLTPTKDLAEGYLVHRPVEVSSSHQADEPAGGILLPRWYNSALHHRRSRMAPIPAVRGPEYRVEANLGYLLAAPYAKRPSVELEERLSKLGESVIHVLMQKTPQGHVCENWGYTRSRTPGFVFTSAQPGTQPLYSCYSEAEKSHLSRKLFSRTTSTSKSETDSLIGLQQLCADEAARPLVSHQA